MTCLKACPHRSVEFNLRPPGIELWTTHNPLSYEVALLFLLLGGVFLHRLPQVEKVWGLSFDLGQFGQHFQLSVLALVVPTIAPLLAYAAIWGIHQVLKTPKPRSFVELAYGYLPLVLGANLAHYLAFGLGEAGRILPVTMATFGMNGANLPIWVVNPAVTTFLQGTTLVVATLLSMVLTQKIAKQPLRFLLPQHLSAIALCWSLWAIVVG
jgi:polyferredoxin